MIDFQSVWNVGSVINLTKKSMDLSLLITGDVVPKGIDPETFVQQGEQIFADMKPHISGVDYSILNLEAPIIKDNPTPIKKSGPCLGIAPSVLSVLKKVGFGVFTLANNHFFDQGQKGVESTIDVCESLNIKIVGGGKTYEQARRPLLLTCKGKRLGIINACEHEFSIANDNHGGSNPLDLINMQEDISSLKRDVDYVIMIIHGGIEMYQYPTPRMKRLYRHFIDLGADAVINHHQHCINGYEVYNGKPIFYGLGNFYFPWGSKRPELWYYGYSVLLILGEDVHFEIIPYKQTDDVIRLCDKSKFENEMVLLNEPIPDDFLLQKRFDEHIRSIEYYLKSQLLPSFFKNKIFAMLCGRGLLGKLYKRNQIYNIKNKLSCESHYESLLRLFTLLQ